MGVWKFYFPDLDESAEDATEAVHPCSFGSWDVAQDACKHDYDERDGWERGDRCFPIVVIDPDGNETHWTGQHEPSVNHTATQRD